MTTVSVRAKEAIKTALAMTIAFGIALAMDWDRPYWAGFAVAMISLPGIGQSLRKGSLRMAGTLVAAVAAITIVSLFPQQRWLFLGTLSLWIGLCAHLMQSSLNPYFWQVCGFVCAIIAFDSGPTATNLFETAVDRTLETGMGILVYTLISVFVWPRSTKSDLDDVSRKLAATQSQLVRSYGNEMAGVDDASDLRPLRSQAVQLTSRLPQTLDGAVADGHEVWEMRHQWRRFAHLSADFGEALDGWRTTFPKIRNLKSAFLLGNLDDVFDAVTARLNQVERMLAGDAPEQTPARIAVEFDEAAVKAPSHLHRAAVARPAARGPSADAYEAPEHGVSRSPTRGKSSPRSLNHSPPLGRRALPPGSAVPFAAAVA